MNTKIKFQFKVVIVILFLTLFIYQIGYFIGSLKFESRRVEEIKIYSKLLKDNSYQNNEALSDFIRVKLYSEYLSGGDKHELISPGIIKPIKSLDIIEKIPLKGGWDTKDLYEKFKRKYDLDRGK